jgi:hypothetical protein
MEGWIKQEYLFAKQGASIWMKSFKGKYGLIKHHMSGNINAPYCNIKTFYPFMPRAIAHEDTLFGSESKLALIVGAQIWPTSTPKDSKRFIGWVSS